MAIVGAQTEWRVGVIERLVLARVLHVVGVALWIGAVAMVTLVLWPAVQPLKSPAERVAFFEPIQGRFTGSF